MPDDPKPIPTPDGGTAPQYGEWFQQIPEALRGQIPAETLKVINEGWLRNKDYTEKTQQVADLRKAAGDRDLAKELAELDQWRGWRKQHWPTIEQQLAALAAANKGGAPDKGGVPTNGAVTGPRAWKDITPDDLFETQRLQQALAAMEQDFSQRAVQGFQGWYQKEEVPRLNNFAMDLAGTLINLLKLAWPQHLPSVDDLLKQAAASNERDFSKIVTDLSSSRKAIEDPAYNRGLEEGKKLATSPVAPPSPAGTGLPTWQRPPNTAPRDEGALMTEVLAEVAKRHGPLPA